MSQPIDTSKRAADMSEAERQAFLQQCRKRAAASPEPVETTKRAKDMSDAEKEEWFSNYKRGLA
jgi:hypothetical protein